MKKLIYLCVCLAVSTAFVSCNKLNDTYKMIDANAVAGNNNTGKVLNYTLTTGDFGTVTGYAAKSHNFSTAADANASIPGILNVKFPNYPTNSTANITYGFQPQLPDSLQADERYTLTTTPTNDYKLLPNNNFNDFSVAQVLTWLPYKFGSATSNTFATPLPAPAANTTVVLTWIFFSPTGVTAPTTFPGLAVSSSTVGTTTTITATGAFSYFNGNWVADYYISPTQYAAVGRSYFLSTDGEANIGSFINGILKTDASIMATAVVGSTQYVSYDYYLTTTKVHYQRVLAVTYNGTNWVPNIATVGIFVSQANGTWIPDPSIYYTLTKADTQYIGDPNGTANQNISTTANRANLYSFGDFATSWTTADLNAAFIFALQKDFPSPKVNTYKVTFLKYTSGADVPTIFAFKWDGTTWTALQQ